MGICGSEAPEEGCLDFQSSAQLYAFPLKKHLCDILCILEKKSRKLDPKILINFYSNKLTGRNSCLWYFSSAGILLAHVEAFVE